MKSQSSNFAYAMNAPTFTTNGACSLATPDPSGKSNGRLSLFFKSVRGLDIKNMYKYMVESTQENTIDTFLLAFHIRDCRGGKGERDIGRQALIWLFINQPHLFEKVASLIPEYGRWDDVLRLFPGVLQLTDINKVRADYVATIPTHESLIDLQRLQNQMVDLMASKIKEDYALMLEGKPCSLVAKWSPTEGDSLDSSFGVYKLLASAMKVSPRNLRKMYLTPLRSYIKIVERYMCSGKWYEIDYNKVPSCAMKRLKKSFEKHDETRFQKWRDALKNNDPSVAKVNAKQLQPHELITEMRIAGSSDDVCMAQWKVMEDECMKNGVLDDDIVVVDTSSSMHSPNFLPLDVACAMGLLISSCSTGKFKNHVISFNTVPNFHVLMDGSIYDRYKQLKSIDWGGSTNIQATFKMILERGKAYGLKQEDMPKRIWIISDMQFNQVNGYGYTTNFKEIEQMYSNSGYIRPQIVFWNVNGGTSDFPVSVDDDGTALISGFSTSVMKAILDGDDSFSPYGIMRKTLDSDRLLPVLKALGVESPVSVVDAEKKG